MHSPVRWPGGKGRLADQIVPHIGEHETYVEACCGGAAVFWAKPREWSKGEILNDLDGELINLYRTLHRRGRRLAAEVDAMPYSRAAFNKLRGARPTGEFRRAARFWYLNRVAFGAIAAGMSYGVRRGQALVLPARILSELEGAVDRLRGVAFECLDVVRLLRLYDGPTTTFYIDPPFLTAARNLYAHGFSEHDHGRLAITLRKVRASWLLSYDDSPEPRRLYRGLPRRRLVCRYSIRPGTRGGHPHVGRQLLISNRPLRRRPDAHKPKRKRPRHGS